MQALTFTQSGMRYWPLAFLRTMVEQRYLLYLLVVQALLDRCDNFYLTWFIEQDTIFNHLRGFIGIPSP